MTAKICQNLQTFNRGILVLLFCFSITSLIAGKLVPTPLMQQEAKWLVQALQQAHYNKVSVKDLNSTGFIHSYLKKLDKQTEKLIKRKEAEALELMSKHAQKLEEKIKALVPNPKKLKYFELVTPYRQPILQDLMDGKDVEESFDDAIFDVVT